MSGAFGQPIKQATIDEYFLTSPGEELVDNTILQMSKIKNNTSNPFVQLFGPYTKGSDQQRWANYDRRDWSIRQFPVINVYEAESQDKTSSNAWVNGTVAMLVCWPSSQRRSDLSRVQMAFQGALLDFFESQEATDMLDELYFIKRDAKVNGLNEYGKIITWTPNVEGIIENEEVPITLVNIKYRIDLRAWYRSLEFQSRTKQEPFQTPLAPLTEIGGVYAGVLNNDGTGVEVLIPEEIEVSSP